jgi:hypothetical protein
MTILVNKENQMTKFIPFIVVLSTFATIACGSGDPAIRPDSEVYVGGASAEPSTGEGGNGSDTEVGGDAGFESTDTCTNDYGERIACICEEFYNDPTRNDDIPHEKCTSTAVIVASENDGVIIQCNYKSTVNPRVCGGTGYHPFICYDEKHVIIKRDYWPEKYKTKTSIVLPSHEVINNGYGNEIIDLFIGCMHDL